MFDTICTLPLSSELFTQALHPTEPILAVGLVAGHVQTFRLPGPDEDDEAHVEAEHGCGKVVTQWRTRRHRGSCRTLGFSVDGEVLYSAGTDGIVKAAATATGQVSSKIAIPLDPATSALDNPTTLHALSPQTFLLATESSALHLYDLRTPSSTFFPNQRPQQTHHPHEDYVSSLTPLPPTDASTSGFSKQWVTTGATTLAVTDLRRGVLSRSEDQEEELLSCVFVRGLPARQGRSSADKVVVGDAGGVLTLWDRGSWEDQQGRIIIDKAIGGGESLDVLAVLPDQIGSERGKFVGVGLGDGRVRIVRLGRNEMFVELRHDEVEGVLGLGVDVGGRLISGGGQTVKLWREAIPDLEAGSDGSVGAKEEDRSGGSDDEEEDEDESDSDEVPRHRRKRKRQKEAKRMKRVQKAKILDFGGID